MKTFFKKKPYALFLAPGFVLYSIFVIYPIFAAGKLSLYKWNGLSGVADEVGKPQDIFLGEVLPKLMLSEMTGEEAVQRIQEEIAKSSAK